MVFEHAIEDENQLPHACRKGHFLGFSRGKKTLVEGPDNRIVPCRRQGGHI